jgi:hypothetical protein
MLHDTTSGRWRRALRTSRGRYADSIALIEPIRDQAPALVAAMLNAT